MQRLIHSIILAPLVLVARPAHADFYALDGPFECLNQAKAVCYDATPSRAAAQPQRRTDASGGAPDAAASASLSPSAATQTASEHRGTTLDPIIEIATRIKEKRPAADDLTALHRAAAAGDPRAIELLAWCALRGIGTERNPVAAYFFYGEAAAAAVPHARENQAAIYSQSLTPEERQRILKIEAMPQSRRVEALLTDAGRP
jgi:TPR repeat protein